MYVGSLALRVVYSDEISVKYARRKEDLEMLAEKNPKVGKITELSRETIQALLH